MDNDFITGASGAIPRSDFDRRIKHADMFYASVRKRTGDIESIANNTGYPVEMIKIVKSHIFYNEYDLGDGVVSRFDPNFDIAESWRRLTEGKGIKEMDCVLLLHEFMEYSLMKLCNLTYREAHEITESVYCYSKYCKDLDREEGLL